MTTNLKTCSSRDAATSALRKLGIAKANYNTFITVPENKKVKTFIVDLGAAEKSLSHIPIEPIRAPTPQVPKKKSVPAKV